MLHKCTYYTLLALLSAASITTSNLLAVTITGDVTPSSPAAWTESINEAYIGNTGHGQLEVTNRERIDSYYGYLGYAAGATGHVSIVGPESTWNGTDLYVGYEGNGTLEITDGGIVYGAYGYIGEKSGATGNVVVDGKDSFWTCYRRIHVGSSEGGSGTLEIRNGGAVGVYEFPLVIDGDGGGENFINMSTGGKLILSGDADDSLSSFLDLIEGTDAIRYWDSSISDWADITQATEGVDYTLEYLSHKTTLTVGVVPETTVPEPSTAIMLLTLLGAISITLLKRCQTRKT